MKKPGVSSSSTVPLFTQQDVVGEASIKPETLKSWLGRGLISSSYNVDGRPLFTEHEKDNIVEFADKRRDERALPKMNTIRRSG